jgi:uncharacterized protein (TIGR03435 family)
MTRATIRASVITLAIGVALGQSATERPSFEVASIRAYPPDAPFPADGSNGFKVSPNGVAWLYARLWFCLAWAYDIPGLVEGPEWTRSRYDIVAKAAAPVPEAQLKLMVQTLLQDRFKLKVHRETRELAVVVLLVAKNGPKNLQPIEIADLTKYEPGNNGKLVFNGSMSDLAGLLSNSPPYGVRERVVDQTGIAGLFSFVLNVKDFDVNDPAFGGKYEEMQSAAFAFISTALGKQYGLKLEHRKMPLDSLVVDSGNKTPTEN